MKQATEISGADVKAGKPTRALSPLQVSVIMIFMMAVIAIGVSSIVTYGSDRRPSEDLFNNSQTITVLQT